MRRPPEIDIVRRAYELWELSGKPEDRDQEFYLQALQELQTALKDRGQRALTLRTQMNSFGKQSIAANKRARPIR
jgi:hypothetical protein